MPRCGGSTRPAAVLSIPLFPVGTAILSSRFQIHLAMARTASLLGASSREGLLAAFEVFEDLVRTSDRESATGTRRSVPASSAPVSRGGTTGEDGAGRSQNLGRRLGVHAFSGRSSGDLRLVLLSDRSFGVGPRRAGYLRRFPRTLVGPAARLPRDLPLLFPLSQPHPSLGTDRG